MSSFPPSLQKLIAELSKLPSIGEKSAVRLAYHLITKGKESAKTLAESINAAAKSVTLCERCFFLTEDRFCSICSNSSRDESIVCVIEKPLDLIAIERVGEFRGVYHVLHGLWAPLKGQSPESLKLRELIERAKSGEVKEVILATASTVEGDATALYIAKALGELGVRTTRLAQGMPKGGELEYADEVTLSRALQGRSVIGG